MRAIALCYLQGMSVKTAVSLDDYVYESAKACSAAAGQSMTEWLNDAARAAARRQNAAAFMAWERERGRTGLDELDDETAAMSLNGAEW